MKTDFIPFKVGTVFNSLHREAEKEVFPKSKSITILYPSRLNAMALDPSKIAVNNNLCYSPGEIIFKAKIFKKVKVELVSGSSIVIDQNSKRRSLIMHAALLMKAAIGFENGMSISVENQFELKHAGLGSSSGLIASVACAINELFGNKIKKDQLLKYLAQNHGEEVEGSDDTLSPVQCIGGSAAAGLYKGGALFLAGENRVIYTFDIPATHKIVIGIPNDYKELDAQTLLEKEIAYFPKFIECGNKFGSTIAYTLVHKVLPALEEGNIQPLGDLIYDYRFNMGSIDNCSYSYEKLPAIAKEVAPLKEKKLADILALSSVGPAFFAITKNPNECISVFEKAGLTSIITEIENDTYHIIEKHE